MINRRHFLHGLAGATAWSLLPRRLAAAGIDHLSEAKVPMRRLTRGPGYHWFGYYDKLEFDPTDRFVLSNQVDFEGRSPTAEDAVRVGMVDLEDGDRWIELGQSSAWGWQQGCMLQWRPGNTREVVWNDRDGDRFICRIKNVDTGRERVLPRPVYALSPDGRWAVTLDFGRLQAARPGYGYQGVPDAHPDEFAPEAAGIWRMDMDTGESTLIISLAQLARIPFDGVVGADRRHWVNHLLVSPDSRRFVFLHRRRFKRADDPTVHIGNRLVTRMFTANLDGSDLHVLDPSGRTSHFVWRDPEHICAWTHPEGLPGGFYVFRDKTSEFSQVGQGVMTVNGHNTYLSIGGGQEWILNDTYPEGEHRQQTPYLYHLPTGRRFDLGHFHSPASYNDEWRCDTHPRSSRDGTKVVIDSPHGGDGRQLWLLDVSAIVG